MERTQLSQALWDHRAAMMRLAMSILRHPQDAEDAVSAAMEKAFRSIAALKDDGAFAPWVMRITANACYDLMRRRKREREYVQGMVQELFTQPQEGGLMEVILTLPKGTAQVITLFYYENFSTADIAQILRIPGAAVRMRLSRGRRLLRAALEEENG